MNNRFIAGKRNQLMLYGVRVDERLELNHEVYGFDRLIDGLDLTSLSAAYSFQGGACYDPAVMVKILFYGYHTGIRSSRKIARACAENVPFLYLAGDLQVKFRAIAEFRSRFVEELEQLFVQIVRLGFKLGLVQGKAICQDGTKWRASASNDGFRTKAEWEEKLKGLECEIKSYFSASIEEDQAEDVAFGRDRTGIEIEDRKELFERMDEFIAEERKIKKDAKKTDATGQTPEVYVQASAAINSEFEQVPDVINPLCDAEEASAREDERENRDCREPTSRPDSGSEQQPEQTSANIVKKITLFQKIKAMLSMNKDEPADRKLNPVDPQCRFMKTKGRIESSYNVQIITEKSFILTVNVSNSAADQGQLQPALEKLSENMPEMQIQSFLADAGYFSGENLKYLSEQQIDAWIPEKAERTIMTEDACAPRNFKAGASESELVCPAGKTLYLEMNSEKKRIYRNRPEACMQCPLRSECLQTTEDRQRGRRSITIDTLTPYRESMRTRMAEPAGRAAYRRRSSDVEPVFGNVKHNRGFTHTLLRGLRKVTVDFTLIAGAHNLAKILHYTTLDPTAQPPPG